MVAINDKKSALVSSVQNITIKTVSEDITVHESSGKSITAWFHGKVSSDSSEDRPYLEVNQNGSTIEICIKRPEATINQIYEDVVLEVSIPKQYADKLSVESVSSNITLDSHAYKDLALTTVSGDINLCDIRVINGGADIHSTSGDVDLTFINVPNNINAETVSGDIFVGIPSNAEFSLDSDTTSGDINCDFPIIVTDSDEDDVGQNISGTVGNGKNTVSAHTTSGDIEINRN
jgi:lia operon protein LiaG